MANQTFGSAAVSFDATSPLLSKPMGTPALVSFIVATGALSLDEVLP